MHVCVATCAHRGDDARIVHRQIRSLLDAGHRVTLVAPLPDESDADPEGLVRVDVPRATGLRRLRPWLAVRRAVRRLDPIPDLILFHDPELVPVFCIGRRGAPTVWDVHEDYVASVSDRAYIWGPIRPVVRSLVRLLLAVARRRCHIILAEDAYAENFPDAAVVPNSTWIGPEPADRSARDAGRPTAVYVGRLSRARGVDDLIEVGRRLRGDVSVVLVGAVDDEVASTLRAAHDEGVVDWLGPLPNPVALEHVRRAACGLSLLHDIPNYRHSRPTKVIEYLANGVPTVTTPLPLAASLVETSGGGLVVPFGDAAAAADAVRTITDPTVGCAMGAAGRRHVAEHHNWAVDGDRFVGLLEGWAR